MYESVRAGQTLLADRAFDAVLYRRRNYVERFFSKIKHFRAVATRYDKRDDNFLASIQLAALRIWLRSYEAVT
jgi:transposase